MSIICGNLRSVLLASSKKSLTPARRKKKKAKEISEIEANGCKNKEVGIKNSFIVFYHNYN